MAVVWLVQMGQPKIMRVAISPPGTPIAAAVKSDLFTAQPAGCPEIDQVADQIEAFLNGAAIRFSLDNILLDLCPDFQQRVLRAEHGIPRSKVSTYQLIAGFIGKPSAARAVGTALATNPFPIIIPCHRAIRSDRTLGGFQGGLKMKRALLAAEGIPFDPKGRVAVADFFYSSRTA
ncbi:MAG: methylated-DNA--[protein]-cysteine S-methyltransferase [Desulfobaccales bacterium]